MNILVLVLSFIPVILILLYLINIYKEDKEYKKRCLLLFGGGALSCGIVILLALPLNLAWGLLKFNEISPLINDAFHTFVLAAVLEEFAKWLMIRRGIKKHKGEPHLLTFLAFGGSVSIGFDILESIIYGLDSSIVEIIVRGVSIPHVAFGFIMAFFMYKTQKSENKAYMILGFAIPIILHGTYDFSLTKSMSELYSDLSVALAFSCVIINFVVLIIGLIKVRKEKRLIIKPISKEEISEEKQLETNEDKINEK